MLHVDDNTLFLTFTYIMMLNMFKFIDFFCKEKGGQVSLEHFGIFR